MNGAGEEGKGKVVCVTGASGYIASWLVKLLLQRGYTVNGTVRDPNAATKTQHLWGLEGAKQRLHLFKAELTEEGCFDSAISGCEGVFHTASPVILNVKDPQADILDPAVKGTLNVLSSCKKFSSVRRVVLTSSVAAVMYNGRPRGPDVVIDESWFSDPEFCKESEVLWYVIAKTLAEEAAWKFVKENGIDMVSVNPGLVIGPMLQPALNQTVALILKLINGEKTHPNGSFTWVHVKDVATAHILAFENPSANGRYCIVESVAHHYKVAKLLRELYPTLARPVEPADEPIAPQYKFSKEKAKSLGIEYIPLKVTLMETVECLKEKGFVSF